MPRCLRDVFDELLLLATASPAAVSSAVGAGGFRGKSGSDALPPAPTADGVEIGSGSVFCFGNSVCSSRTITTGTTGPLRRVAGRPRVAGDPADFPSALVAVSRGEEGGVCTGERPSISASRNDAAAPVSEGVIDVDNEVFVDFRVGGTAAGAAAAAGVTIGADGKEVAREEDEKGEAAERGIVLARAPSGALTGLAGLVAGGGRGGSGHSVFRGESVGNVELAAERCGGGWLDDRATLHASAGSTRAGIVGAASPPLPLEVVPRTGAWAGRSGLCEGLPVRVGVEAREGMGGRPGTIPAINCADAAWQYDGLDGRKALFDTGRD